MAQVIFFDFLNIDTVIADFALLDVVKPVDEVGNGGFPCTGRTDESNFLSRLCIEGYVFEDVFFAVITEGDVFKLYIAF